MESDLLLKEAKPLKGKPPKEIHFIWIGGPIPPKYLQTIKRITALANKSGFKVNLWVDDEMNYHQTAAKHDLSISDLKIRNIDELLKRIHSDPFYKTEDRMKYFQYCVEREGVGFKNLSAAGDFLKYELIRQQGGYYFDTDTIFQYKWEALTEAIKQVRNHIKKAEKLLGEIKEQLNDASLTSDQKDFLATKQENIESELASLKMIEKKKSDKFLKLNLLLDEQLTNEELPLGIMVNGMFKTRESKEGITLNKYQIQMGADVIVAVPDHPALEFAILEGMDKYKKFDEEEELDLRARGIGLKDKSHPSVEVRQMDAKRFPYDPGGVEGARAQYTIEASGPNILREGICKFWNSIYQKYRIEEHSSLIQSMSAFVGQMKETNPLSKIFNSKLLMIFSRSDQTWLLKTNENESDEEKRTRLKNEMANKLRPAYVDLPGMFTGKKSRGSLLPNKSESLEPDTPKSEFGKKS